MKKIFYYGAFIALISGTFISCDKDEIINPTNGQVESNQQNVNKIDQQNIYYVNLTDAQKYAEYEKMGAKHNQGVEYVYSYVSSRKTANSTQNDLYVLSKAGTLEYINTLGTTTDPYTVELKTNVNNVFTTVPTSIANFTDLYNSTSLTTAQKNYIHQLESILDNSDNSTPKSVSNSIINLENQALSTLSNEEEPLVLSMMAVAKYSFNYWTTNNAKWLILTSTPDNPNPSPAAYKPNKVGKADAKGAAAGAAAWGAGAVFGGPVTWGAFFISTASWSVGCSIYEWW